MKGYETLFEDEEAYKVFLEKFEISADEKKEYLTILKSSVEAIDKKEDGVNPLLSSNDTFKEYLLNAEHVLMNLCLSFKIPPKREYGYTDRKGNWDWCRCYFHKYLHDSFDPNEKWVVDCHEQAGANLIFNSIFHNKENFPEKKNGTG